MDSLHKTQRECDEVFGNPLKRPGVGSGWVLALPHRHYGARRRGYGPRRVLVCVFPIERQHAAHQTLTYYRIVPCAIDCRVGCAHTPPANVRVDAQQQYDVLSECGIPSGLPREGTLQFTHRDGHRLVMKELHIIGIRALGRHGGASTTALTDDRLSSSCERHGIETPSNHRRSTADTSPRHVRPELPHG